jgi:D-amino peptidase
VLAHTINSFAFARVWFNEQELGEAGIYGALAGERGVPVAVASGDDVFIRETQPLFPHTTFVETKRAEGQNTGTSLSPEQSCDAIHAAVKNAVQRRYFGRPFQIAPPIVCRLQTQTPALADLFCQWPALERVDGTMLRFAADSVEHAVRMLNSLSAMSTMLR